MFHAFLLVIIGIISLHQRKKKYAVTDTGTNNKISHLFNKESSLFVKKCCTNNPERKGDGVLKVFSDEKSLESSSLLSSEVCIDIMYMRQYFHGSLQ